MADDSVISLPEVEVERPDVPATPASYAVPAKPMPAASLAVTAPAPGPQSSYKRRRLEMTYTLGKSTFDGINDTIHLADMRMGVTIAKAGMLGYQGTLQAQVFGLSLDHMTKMTLFQGDPRNVNPYNTVTILAGAEGEAMAVAYKGTVTNAFADFRAAPTVPFNIIAFGAAAAAKKLDAPTSYGGQADAADLLEALAGKMGLRFENHGVSVMLSNPYFDGSQLYQAEEIARAAGINLTVDDGVLAIWPAGSSRKGDAVPLISAKTGMVGYPVPNQVGIDVVCLYNPSIRVGGKIKVDSIAPSASGEFVVAQMTHILSCDAPGGAWFTELSCVRLTVMTPTS